MTISITKTAINFGTYSMSLHPAGIEIDGRLIDLLPFDNELFVITSIVSFLLLFVFILLN